MGAIEHRRRIGFAKSHVRTKKKDKKLFNLIHPTLALVIVLVFDQFGLSLVGAVLVSAFFAGREHAQAEYKWIEHYGNGKRANMKWWNAFEPRVWDFHSWFWNLVAPIGVAFSFVLL